MVRKANQSIVFKMLKISLIASGFFILCYCAPDYIKEDAKAIYSEIKLNRIIGNDQAQIEIRYFADPLGNFTIEEVEVGNQKISGLPIKAEQMVGCAGVIVFIDVKLPKENINFDKNEKTLQIKTKWQGRSQKELKEKFDLASFAVGTVSREVSEDKPLSIKFAQEIKSSDWGLCSVEFANASAEAAPEKTWSDYYVVFLGKKDAIEEDTINSLDISLDQIRDGFVQRNAKLAKSLKAKIVCQKSIKGAQSKGGKGNVFIYQLSSVEYDVEIK